MAWPGEKHKLERSCINVDICSLVVENFPRIYLSFITDDQVSSHINMLSIGKMEW